MGTYIGNSGNNEIHGSNDKDTIRGLDGHDLLYGERGSDRIFGGEGDDEIYGGRGSDQLYGDAGADIFAYTNQLDSGQGSPDTIMDFKLADDKIDLQDVDANSVDTGDQQFNEVPSFTKVPAQLTIGTDRVEGDINGDGAPDFMIMFDPLSELPNSASFLW